MSVHVKILDIFTPIVPCNKRGKNVRIFRCAETKLLIGFYFISVKVIPKSHEIAHASQTSVCRFLGFSADGFIFRER